MVSGGFHRGLCCGYTQCRCTVSENKGQCNLSLWSHPLQQSKPSPHSAPGFIKQNDGHGRLLGVRCHTWKGSGQDENLVCKWSQAGCGSGYVDAVPLSPPSTCCHPKATYIVVRSFCLCALTLWPPQTHSVRTCQVKDPLLIVATCFFCP